MTMAAFGLTPVKLQTSVLDKATSDRDVVYFFERRLTTARELEQSFQLRFQVYCRERGFLDERDFSDGIETDRFDDASLHFGSYDRSGELVGTVRLVGGALRDLPMAEHCVLDAECTRRLAKLPRLVEISRLAISRSYRRRANDGAYGIGEPGPEAAGTTVPEQRRNKYAIVFTLYRAMYQTAKRRGIRHVVAAMESSLHRIMAFHRFPFHQIGPIVDYYGPVMPFYLDLDELESTLSKYNPEMFKYFNEGISLTTRDLIA